MVKGFCYYYYSTNNLFTYILFYVMLQALTKLDQLEVQLATTESQALSPQLAALHNTVSKSIDEITVSPLQEGYSILDSVPGAEVIFDCKPFVIIAITKWLI